MITPTIGAHQAAALASGTSMQKTAGINLPTFHTRYLVPPDFDARVISNINGYEEHAGYLAPAFEVFSAAYGGLQRLSDARETASKLGKKGGWTEGQQILQISKEAAKFQDAILKKFDSARKQLSDGIRGLEDSLTTPLTHKADTTVSGEIRKFVHDMPLEKRHDFIKDRLDKNDTRTLTAVLGGPAYISGLTDEIQATYIRMFHEKNQPVIAQRVTAMKQALELVEARGPRVLVEIEKAMGAKWSRVTELSKSQDEIQRMLAAVNVPVQP